MGLSPLSTSNIELQDGEGKVLNRVIGGVNVAGQFWNPYRTYEFGDGEQQFIYMKRWGINCVRVLIEELDGYPGDYERWKDPSTYPLIQPRMDKLIDDAADYGIYVMIAYWTYQNTQISGWSEARWNEWIGFWSDNADYGIALRYADKTNVIFDLFNEWAGLTGSQYQTRFRACIDAVKAEKSDALCVVEEMLWGAGGNPKGLLYETTDPLNRTNVLFSIHNYLDQDPADDEWKFWTQQSGWMWPTEANYEQVLSDKYATWCLANNRAVNIGELGIKERFSNTYIDYEVLRMMLTKHLEENYAGSIVWGWRAPPKPHAFIADWYGRPTWRGHVFREYLKPEKPRRELF